MKEYVVRGGEVKEFERYAVSFPLASGIALIDRAMQVHGKVCMIETRGPKRSLYLSVYREFEGTRYVIRRTPGAKQFNDVKILEVMVP